MHSLIVRTVGTVALLLFIVPLLSFAQTPTPTITPPPASPRFSVPSLGIYDSTSVMESGFIRIATNLVNNASEERTYDLGVEFHIKPTNPDDPSSPVYYYLIPSTYTLKAGERLSTSFMVPSPDLPEGEYRLFVGAEDGAGNLSGKMYVGDVRLTGTSPITLSDCTLSGKKPENFLIAFSEDENPNPIKVVCTGVSKGNADQGATVAVRVKGSEYGEQELGRVTTSIGKTPTTITIDGTNSLLPGYYFLEVVTMNEEGKALGIPFTGYLQYKGIGGKINNLSDIAVPLTEGETIEVGVQLLLANNAAYTLELDLSSDGDSCAEPLILNPKGPERIITSDLTTTADCPQPTLTATLKAPDGSTLDTFSRTYGTSEGQPSNENRPAPLSRGTQLTIVLFLICALGVIWYMKRGSLIDTRMLFAMFLLVGVLALAFYATSARAGVGYGTTGVWCETDNAACGSTYHQQGWVEAYAYGSASLNSGKPGAQSSGTYTVYLPTGSDITWGSSATANFSGDNLPSKTLTVSYPTPSVSWPFTFTLPSSVGQYYGNISVSMNNWANPYGGYMTCGMDWTFFGGICLQTGFFDFPSYLVITECTDYWDNDGDGKVDYNGYPQPDPDCSGPNDDREAGDPVNCVGSWVSTGSCSATCGGGVLQERFTVTSPAKNGGWCEAVDGTTRWGSTSCNTQGCPVNCTASWVDTGICSVACGGGVLQQRFTVTSPAQNGGWCETYDGNTRWGSTSCNTQACVTPINCVGSWSNTSTCSVSCGGGVLQQVYTVTTPAQNGGTACPYANGATQWGTTSCNTQACPPTCVANQGQACRSTANTCGQTNPGTIQCDGSCSAIPPSNASCTSNQSPSVNAGPDRTITLGQNVTINGASASDSDGTITSISWFFASGPTTPTISGGTTYTPTFSGLSMVGEYYFVLRVRDNDGAIGEDYMKVTVGIASTELTLSASPNPVQIGKSTTLSWNTGSYDPSTDIPNSQCTISGTGLSSYPVTATTGTVNVVVNAESTYTLVCPNGNRKSVTVKVIPIVYPN